MSEQLSALTPPLNGRYQIQEILGTGGMGTVYRAEDRNLGESVAVKMLGQSAASDRHFLALFTREVTLLKRLRHPGIVQVLDAGVYQERPFLVMEYVAGENLATVFQRNGTPPVELAVDIAMQAAGALGAAHQIGISHCDIKPANLLLTMRKPDGTTSPFGSGWPGRTQMKVVDFGIAHSATTTGFFPPGQVFGTARYMAPEQATGEGVSPATDVYALGLVLYELLTGQTPFPGRTAQEQLVQRLSMAPADPRRLRPETPVALAQIVQVMLARDPRQRYANGDRLVAALSTVPLGPWGQARPAGNGSSRPFVTPAVPPINLTAPSGTLANSYQANTERMADLPVGAYAPTALEASPFHQSDRRRRLALMCGLLLVVSLLGLGLAASLHHPDRGVRTAITPQATAPAVETPQPSPTVLALPTSIPDQTSTPTVSPVQKGNHPKHGKKH